jgi:hypothetical protein
VDAFVCTVFFLVISFTIFPRVLFSGRGNSITLGYLLYSIRIISGLIESAFLFSRPSTLIIPLFLLFFWVAYALFKGSSAAHKKEQLGREHN